MHNNVNLQIMKACDKVLSLSIQEPLMKVLAGLEYILRKAQVSIYHAIFKSESWFVVFRTGRNMQPHMFLCAPSLRL